MAETTARITLVGLDLIGTSIGLSLRENAGNYQVIGNDRDPTPGHHDRTAVGTGGVFAADS